MKINKVLVVALLAMVLLPMSFATATKVSGDISLTWANAYDRPQQFTGIVTGDLAGTIALTTTTDYDAVASNVGVTWSDNVVLYTDASTTCEGFYAGANVNAGRNAGTFTLNCDDGNIVQGMMHGVNDAFGNLQVSYSGLLIAPTPGPKGDQGEQGLPGADGKDGIDGLPGEKGDKGDQGEQGLPGVDGINGTDGAQGPQGEQGIQGLKGDKGDTGASGDPTELLATMFAYPGFADFQTWYNSDKECTTGQNKCQGNDKYTCTGYEWNFAQTCTYGCSAGACLPQPRENCQTKASTYGCKTGNAYSITTDYYYCTSGHGTNTACEPGFCKGTILQKYCYGKGCNNATGKCNV